jgi:hypothetical protein
MHDRLPVLQDPALIGNLEGRARRDEKHGSKGTDARFAA